MRSLLKQHTVLAMIFLFLFVISGCDDPPPSDHDADSDAGLDGDQDSEPDSDTDSDESDADESDADETDGDDSDADEETCDGCMIGEICFADDETDPDNVCLICDPDTSATDWTDNDGVTCDDDDFCTGEGTCSKGSCQLTDGPCKEGQRCDSDLESCCDLEDHAACNDAGNVVWFDSCDVEGDIIETCPEGDHHTCVDAECVCDPGWTGDACDVCLIYVNAEDGDDADDGRTWEDAKATIQAALEVAATESCDIWVAAGTYYATDGTDAEATLQLLSDHGLYGGFAGTEQSLSARDLETNVSILSGDIGTADDPSDNTYNIVTGADGAILDGFTITDGQASNRGLNGGGLYNVDLTSLTVANCTFEGNVGIMGGAVYNSASTVSFSNCIFDGNSSMAGGGALYLTGENTITIEDCTFTSNTSSSPGGAISLSSGVSIEATNSVFSENSSGSAPGGALYATTSASPPGEISFVNCTLTGNSGSPGGAIYYYGGPLLSFVNSTCEDNTTAPGGGPGGCAYLQTATQADFVNSLIVGGSTTSIGGAISTSGTSLGVDSCTIVENSASAGGGIYASGGSASITNSILWGNTAAGGPLLDQQISRSETTDEPVVTYSDVQGDDETVHDGTGNINDDPLFDVDAYTLSEDSPCLDVGSSDDLPADVYDLDDDGDVEEALPIDLDGNDRVVGDGLDMGAYERP